MTSTDRAATVDRGPSRFGLSLSGAATVTAVAAVLLVSPTGALVTLFGGFVLAVGVALDRLGVRDAGLVAMLAGPVLGGLAAPAVVPPLVATVAIVLARDTADNAIDVGAQLGAHARTRRAEAVHATGTLVVGLAGAAAGFLVYALAGGGRPVTALVVLLAGAFALLLAIRT